MHYTAAQCDLKKHNFYKGSTPSDWNRAQLSRPEIQVCVSTKLSSWPMGWAICDFWPFLLLPHFSSEMPIFTVRNTHGPPNRLLGGPRTGPFFEKTWSPNRPSSTYIYIYNHEIVCLIWGGCKLFFSYSPPPGIGPPPQPTPLPGSQFRVVCRSFSSRF